MPSPRPAEFLQGRERIILAITAGICRKRARLATGKPKILRLAGITARASPANLRVARGGIEKHRHLIVAAIMRLARSCGEKTLAIAGHRPIGTMCESTRSAGDVAIRRLISESGYWQQAETRGSNPFLYANDIKCYAAYLVRWTRWGSMREAAGRGFAVRRLHRPQTHETPPPQSTPTESMPTPPRRTLRTPLILRPGVRPSM